MSADWSQKQALLAIGHVIHHLRDTRLPGISTNGCDPDQLMDVIQITRSLGSALEHESELAVLSTWTFGTFVGEFSSEARRFA